MPEIGEVARTVHYIRKHLVGRTIAKVTALDDAKVYGAVGCSAAEFEKQITGKKVVDAGQQGKYFWMIMSSPPHPVMHFSMSGWIKYKSEHTFYYQPKKGEEKQVWPPKFMKFMLETKPEKGQETIEAAFVDMRRFARIRLVDCAADQIRKRTPLKENGPDPVVDKDEVTLDWLTEKCRSKKVPIKAMLLDQSIISGIGNWVADEIMYNAKMHPEQYANTLSDEQIKQLHKSIHYICGTAVELLADSEKFPEDWLFKHRWGKGKKDKEMTLPNGEKIAYLTVGGRTSCVVPSIQKKTGPVAKEMSEAEMPNEKDEKPKKAKAKKRKADDDEDDGDEDHEAEDEIEPEQKPQKRAAGKKAALKKESKDTPTVNGDAGDQKVNGAAKSKPASKATKKSKVKDETEPEPKKMKGKANKTEKAAPPPDTGRRRSGRLSGT